MSYTTAARLSRPKFVVAIAGSTGKLGQSIAKVFLGSYRAFFSRVICLVRSTSDTSAELEMLGAELILVDYESTESLSHALKGLTVDALINTLGGVSVEIQNRLAHIALKECGIPVYFLSEFGVLNNLLGYDHDECIHKEHIVFTRRLAAELELYAGEKPKVIAVYTGLFLEDSMNGWSGFNTDRNLRTCVSSPSQRITFTSKSDIARSLAELVILSGTSPDKLPTDIKLAGCTRTFQQIGDTLTSGVEDSVKLETHVELDQCLWGFGDKYSSGERTYPREHIRALMSRNLLDFSVDNNNDLVNPEELVWKWDSIEEYLNPQH